MALSGATSFCAIPSSPTPLRCSRRYESTLPCPHHQATTTRTCRLQAQSSRYVYMQSLCRLSASRLCTTGSSWNTAPTFARTKSLQSACASWALPRSSCRALSDFINTDVRAKNAVAADELTNLLAAGLSLSTLAPIDLTTAPKPIPPKKRPGVNGAPSHLSCCS